MPFSFAQATPESVGIPSDAILRYTDALEDLALSLHSLTVIRRGAVVFDGQYSPMTSGQPHRLYSCSKSFVSLAVGILCGEGRLRLSDRVADFFPEYDKAKMHPFLRETTVEDLLRMTDCHDETTYNMDKAEPDMDWVRTYFETPPTHRAGTVFQYNTACTVMLSVIVERITGASFLETLRPRVFEPMGMTKDIQCVRTPCGHAWGGSGVLASAQDLAKMAYLCMRGGEIDGRQLLPREYVRRATSRQVDNALFSDDAEHRAGYGYQIWRIRHNGFAFLGMGSQQAFCFPDEDLLVVLTGDTQDVPAAAQNELTLLFSTIFPALSKDPLPENPEALRRLAARRESLTLYAETGGGYSPYGQRMSGRTFRFPENALGWKWARFDFDGDEGSLSYENATGPHRVAFAYGRNVEQAFDETSYYAMDIGHPAYRPLHAFASAGWKDPHTLLLRLCIADVCFGTLRLCFVFDGQELTVAGRKNAEWFFREYQGFATGQADPATGRADPATGQADPA